ncbi:hypothetical protein LWI28_025912 [Acer negundo]|uniref:Uncharacterized protein n=1 Tax=Acer negundo TaxID=4023 RepID=A0AAD5JJE6_ACENE|nr:hypothetical protein LWI28_025912 [Acer negundo]KAK4859620.1 hypothetical protein QYF36_008810 [Acer negundo]
MAIDDDESFTKPGTIPFKWEIRPGVPKIQLHQHKQTPNSSPQESPAHKHKSPTPPLKLKPPPAGFQFLPPFEPQARTQSFRSTPHARSERWRFDLPTRIGPEYVSPGCFPSPFLKQRDSKRRVNECRPESEPGYSSDLESLTRWSVSSRKSLSQLSSSPASSSFSSYKSSPRPMSDAEWAGFGLF